jgi:ribosomal protein L7/L12
MRKELLTLIERINCSQSLEVAKAYADAALIVAKSQKAKLVSVKIEAGNTGINYPFINVIKEVRAIFGFGLKESKDMVEFGHTWKKLSHAYATNVVARLKAQGATVSIIEE